METQRLILRYFDLSDAERVQVLASCKEIADTTANVPHPYPDGAAEKWISTHRSLRDKRETLIYALALKKTRDLIGVISLRGIDSDAPEIGYWIGKEFWNKGYCTEACAKLLEICRSELGLSVVYARHLARNPSSGRVLEKCGLELVGSKTDKIGYMDREEEFFIYKMDFG